VFNTAIDYCEDYGHDLLTGAANEKKDLAALQADGRAVLKAARYLPPHEPPDDDYPLLFTSGRTAYHFHTRTKTGRAPQLQAAAPEPWVEICPADAEQLGIADGDVVRVESRRGRLEAAARVKGIREGVVFAPFHYGYWDHPGEHGGAGPNGHPTAANELTITDWDPVSKQPLFKTCAARVSLVERTDGTPAPAPTTTASAPAAVGSVRPTTGGPDAYATHTTAAATTEGRRP
jgi:ferredoxin-nitrate reductase